jgi:enoyl-CoA hydratase
VFELTQQGRVAVLRMTHGKANALDLEFCRALSAQIHAFQQSPAAALVITGQGKIFSAGVDLVRLIEGGSAYVQEFLAAMNHGFEALFAFPKPLVVAVNGHAIAGGCVITCCGDYRIMTRGSGRIGIPELALIYRGLTAGAEDALGYGLIDAVVDPDRLLDEAIAVAESLAAVPFEAFHLTKRLLREPALRHMHEADVIDGVVRDAWAGDAVQAAVRDYVARTLRK